jgi:hypothetical protein
MARRNWGSTILDCFPTDPPHNAHPYPTHDLSQGNLPYRSRALGGRICAHLDSLLTSGQTGAHPPFEPSDNPAHRSSSTPNDHGKSNRGWDGRYLPGGGAMVLPTTVGSGDLGRYLPPPEPEKSTFPCLASSPF